MLVTVNMIPIAIAFLANSVTHLRMVRVTRRPFIFGATLASCASASKSCASTTLEAEGTEEAVIATTPATRCLRYYGPIETKSLLSLNSILCNMSEESEEPIHLHIQSSGGELIPALYTADLIASLSPEIHTYVDGICASAATLLTISGDVRHMSKNSIFMIHQLSNIQSGKYDDLIQSLKNSDVLMEKLIDNYMQKSKFQLATLKQLLALDKYLDSKTCLEYGLIDIID